MIASIIILNYKSVGLVKNCLKSIYEFPPSGEFEIIVVDNNSADNSLAKIAKDFPAVKTISASSNRGFAAGNNLGLKVAQGDYIFIVNPDIMLSENTFDKLINFFQTNKKVGLCAPKLLNPDKSLQYNATLFPDWRLPFFRRTFLSRTSRGRTWVNQYLMKDWDHASSRQVDCLFGAFLAVNRQALPDIGYLDERYFMYMEDIDWCLRCWQKHWQVWYCADTSVIHLHQRESADVLGLRGLLKKSGRVHLVSWLKYFLKNGWQIKNPHL